MVTHKDLRVWQQSIDFVVNIYKITANYPKDELFGLVSQMRRAAVSIPSNIAEGYARGSNKEKLHFLRISSGSFSELETQLLISYKLNLISDEQYTSLSESLTTIWKQLNALTTNVSKQIVAAIPNDQTTKPQNDYNNG